jgi:hypothetical protein
MTGDDDLDLNQVLEEATKELRRFNDEAERGGSRFVGADASKSALGEVADGGFFTGSRAGSAFRSGQAVVSRRAGSARW